MRQTVACGRNVSYTGKVQPILWVTHTKYNTYVVRGKDGKYIFFYLREPLIHHDIVSLGMVVLVAQLRVVCAGHLGFHAPSLTHTHTHDINNGDQTHLCSYWYELWLGQRYSEPHPSTTLSPPHRERGSQPFTKLLNCQWVIMLLLDNDTIEAEQRFKGYSLWTSSCSVL